MRKCKRSISPALVRSILEKARVPTTFRGFLSETPKIIFPPPSLASATQYLTNFSKSKCFFASLNSRCSSSEDFIHVDSCSIVMLIMLVSFSKLFMKSNASTIFYTQCIDNLFAKTFTMYACAIQLYYYTIQ